MNVLDLIVVAVYMAGMIAMSAFLGRKQKDERDYYVGGNDVSHFAIALSTMATQCSTNSLLGAPAFVIAVGGLLWLQYELAVPLAMIGTMVFLLPFFRKNNLVSVYEFCIHYLPHGVIGIIIVALFAAAMSSLDSTINSLSATTIRDIIERFWVGGSLEGVQQLRWSRLLTVFWGIICIVFSFFVGGISKSIIESINKLSSLMNGPLLATFMLAILTRKANDKGTIVGILTGFLVNLYLWIAHPEISWLWWNFIGCAITFGVGYAVSLKIEAKAIPANIDDLVYHKNSAQFFGYKKNWPTYYAILVGYFAAMVFILKLIGR